MEKKLPKKLSDDIKTWCLEIKDTDLVFFEQYEKTIARNTTENKEEYNFDDDDDEDFGLKLKDLPNIYSSPMGPVVIPELTDASKHFKLWTIYTKVPFTVRLLTKIERVPGIETLESIARYRARIGIAPLFKDRIVIDKVRKIIEDSILSELK